MKSRARRPRSARESRSSPLGDPQLLVPVNPQLLLIVQRRHRDRTGARLTIVHQLLEGRGSHHDELDGTAVVERIAADPSDNARGGDGGCRQLVPSRDHGGELLRQHVKAHLVRVNGQPCARPPMTDRVTLTRKRNVERTGLSLPHLLHLQGAAVILATNSAAAL